MDDIAGMLGISKKTLYQFVPNKSELVDQIIRNHIEREKKMIFQILEESENAIDEMLRISRFVVSQMRDLSPTTVFDLRKYYPESWNICEEYNGEFVYEHIRKNIERGIEEGLYLPETNANIIAKMYVSQTFVLVDENIFPLKNYDRQELFEQFMTYHIRGIACKEGITILEDLLK